jgi:sugar lactone lactonase YvrE
MKNSGPEHIAADLDDPAWIEDFGGGSYLITDTGHNRICILALSRRSVTTYIDLKPHGMQNPANCILDAHGRIWINDPTMAMLWIFTSSGELIRALGSGNATFPSGNATLPSGDALPQGKTKPAVQEWSLEDMDLGQVYDIRRGNDGLVYILEGSRLRLRAVDFQRNMVMRVAGCGARGYSGDGGDPRAAAFGSLRTSRFDGPWAFCLDSENAIYIADTQNGAVRAIDSGRKRISTIAGGRIPQAGARCNPGEIDPLCLALPSICWMDWGENKLFVTDRTGDLVVLAPEC